MPDALITVYQLTVAAEQERYEESGKGKGKGKVKGRGRGGGKSQSHIQAINCLQRAHEMNLQLTGPSSPETTRSAAMLVEETGTEE